MLSLILYTQFASDDTLWLAHSPARTIDITGRIGGVLRRELDVNGASSAALPSASDAASTAANSACVSLVVNV
jgi:hypothetical protein